MTTYRVARRTRFTVVDRAAVNDAGLSFRARGVLVWLLDKQDDWRCSSDAIAAAGREGREAVRAALRELEAAGYLRREKTQGPDGRWQTTTSVYESPTDAQKPVVGSPGVGSSGANTEDCVPKTETEELTRLPVGSSSAPEPAAARVSTPEVVSVFDKFWAAYPRKTGKRAASQAWTKAMERTTLDTIRDGLRAWLRYWQATVTEERYIPHAATWLNDDRYEKDPPPLPARRGADAGFWEELRDA